MVDWMADLWVASMVATMDYQLAVWTVDWKADKSVESLVNYLVGCMAALKVDLMDIPTVDRKVVRWVESVDSMVVTTASSMAGTSVYLMAEL